MNIHTTAKVSGKLNWLRIIRDGKVIEFPGLDNIPNILLNTAMGGDGAVAIIGGAATTFTSTLDSFEDLNGTWNQTGNTVNRATGTGIFPVSLTRVGCEIRFATGERCHVLTRISDTSITVSGPARTINGQAIRCFLVNGQAFFGSSVQTNSSGGTEVAVLDHVAGFVERTRTFNFPSAVSAYSLGSVIVSSGRVKLPAPIAINVDDQIQFSYSRRETVSNRNQTYELGAESVGIPQRFAMTSIVGNGTAVDVTFSAATIFLAGDKLDLRGVTTLAFNISSASSTSTTFTITTSSAHGLIAGNACAIAGASLAGYNGSFTVASAPTSTTLTITNSANPGAMGASGTIRAATPGAYFNTLGLVTIASMVSSTVARITSTVTGAPVNPSQIGGDPGVTVRVRRRDTTHWSLFNGNCFLYTEANAKALVDDSAQAAATYADTTGAVTLAASAQTLADTTNDFTTSTLLTYNSGAGTANARIKQFLMNHSSGAWCQITFNTPFSKDITQRLRITTSKQLLRDLP